MSDLYETDTVSWAREQAGLLRRLSEGERVNDQVDWRNVIEEIEALSRTETRAATSPLTNAMQHKLYLLGWPGNLAERHWQAEVASQLADAAEEYRESMRREIEPAWERLYRRARRRALTHMLDAGPPAVPLPDACPWTLDELLAEGDAALRA